MLGERGMRLSILLAVLLSSGPCTHPVLAGETSLRIAVAGRFAIGMALSSADLRDPAIVALAARHISVATACHLDRVTFWNVHDGRSWRNDWPTPGRSDHPLLFDRSPQPQPAFHAVIGMAAAARPVAASSNPGTDP